ncbi:MAG TPA: Gfo/Idh/MocA family oxidoreductase [Thermomicrobiales bacterium]|nr:Gfo/Idh/MocA family oxidoreductase [Thermomicrobiales bacterium]
MTDRQLRIGIIGLGIGMRHASSFAQVPEAKIVAMADPAPARLGVSLEEFCAHYGAKPYADGFEMMEREGLDAVSICTNPKLHRPMVEAAARRGLQVLVEKPMAGTDEDCEAMIAACQRAGVSLHMEFPMRQLAPMVELRRVVDAGHLGTPFFLAAEYVCGPRPGPPWIWQMGDGSSVINENTCHAIDAACYLLGDVDRVYAEGGNYIGHGAPLADTAAFTLHFRNGGVATVVGGGVATNELGIRPRLSLYGTAGQAYVEGIYHTFHLLRWAPRGGDVVEHDYGAPAGPSQAGGSFARYPLLEPALANFVSDVLAGRPPTATAEDGYQNVRICLAVLESIRTGQPVYVD